MERGVGGGGGGHKRGRTEIGAALASGGGGGVRWRYEYRHAPRRWHDTWIPGASCLYHVLRHASPSWAKTARLRGFFIRSYAVLVLEGSATGYHPLRPTLSRWELLAMLLQGGCAALFPWPTGVRDVTARRLGFFRIPSTDRAEIRAGATLPTRDVTTSKMSSL